MAARTSGVGLGIAVFSAATFGTSGSFADSLMAAGWTPGGAVTVRIAIAAAVLMVPALVLLRGRWALLWRSAGAVTAFGLVAVAACQLCFFNAVEHLSVGVALLLEYSGTLLVVLWMWLRHHQRPTRLTVVGGLVAIVGLVLVLDLTGPQRVDVVGVLWGLGAATGLAVYFVVSAHTEDLVHPVAMAWAGMTLGAVALAVLALAGAIPFGTLATDVQLAGHSMSWIVPALGVALVSTVAAYCTGIAAARRLGARVASFVGLAEVLSAILFAWLLLSQRPSLLQLVGGAVVVAGIALVRLGERDEDEDGAATLEIPLAGGIVVRVTRPPSDARRVTVGAERLERWLAGFRERHGETVEITSGEWVELTGADAARAWVEVPFPPLSGGLVEHARRERRIGVLLVRRGGYAAGVFDGARLVASKTGSNYVQGGTKKGGWSQQRYARRRANQADAAFAAAADGAAGVLAGATLDGFVAGGDRDAVRAVLADRRLAHLEPRGPWLEVKDPRLKVLAATPDQFRAVRISLVP